MKGRDPLEECVGFEWDDGNITKSWKGHRVTIWETEAVFFNEPLIVAEDLGLSPREPRFFALGQTDAGREMFVAFTIRKNLVRVISARDMTRREWNVHERKKAEDSA